MTYRRGDHASVAPKGPGGAGPTAARVIVIITCVIAVVAMVRGSRDPPASAEALPGPQVTGAAATPASGTEVSGGDPSTPPPALANEEAPQGAAPTPTVRRVGIVAGHWGHDDGASCDDGLAEVDVNLAIAEFVVRSLRGLGYQVDLLQEYDDRLTGYSAAALVSIHADSCQRIDGATPPPTGFKVASVVDSVVPMEEQRLVECLTEAYAERTGLPFHENSITGHMTGYHTFYDIDGRTPGAIIETGFLWLDRDLLTLRPDIVAQGIVDGILCFVESD